MTDERVSVIIPFSGASKVSRLIRVLESLCPQKEVRDQIIVVEQCDTNTRAAAAACSNRGVSYERLSLGGKFNLGACLNRAMNTSWNEVHVVCHADCLKAPDFFSNARRLMAEPGQCFFGHVGSLGNVPSADLMAISSNNPRALTLEEFNSFWSFTTPIVQEWGDSCVFRRKDWRGVGRFFEHFNGIGPVGEDFMDRMRFQVRVMRSSDLRSMHLWHPVSATNKADYEANLPIFEHRTKFRHFKRTVPQGRLVEAKLTCATEKVMV